MSEIDVARPETIALSEESMTYARDALVAFEAELKEDIPLTELKAHDSSKKYLREIDRETQAQLSNSDFVAFGHTNPIDSLLYEALIKGYNPSTEQLEKDKGYNFMWDEILELSNNHPDIAWMLNRFGYRSTETPIPPSNTGVQIIPRDVVRNMLGTLYMRGQEYRAWGYGFPNWSNNSDELTENEE